jgi:primosomal protein N' (replication factor Y)
MCEQNGREIIRAGDRVAVLLPLVFANAFDYRVEGGMELAAGDWVRVPFGRKSLWGVVWGKGSGDVEEAKLRTVEAFAAHLPPMSAPMRSFIEWVAWYTLAPSGMVLKMAIAVPEALEQSGEKEGGRGKRVKERKKQPPEPPHPPLLSLTQAAAATELRTALARGFSVHVLDGVTGSGKTEVYFDTIAEALHVGKQAVVLLPEIALSVQWLGRFTARFGFTPHLWHSGVTPARRRDTWRQVALGEARVVVGARSALFLPFCALGVIVIDEEHDGSYKQEDGVIYHARDMGVARARAEKIPILLVSATPSLETEYNIAQGRYIRLHLPSRHGAAEMPQIKLIDMRSEKLDAQHWLSQPLKDALLATLACKQQAMLFMNRRGYAPLMLCRSCGHRFQCPHCTSWLVLHRSRAKLLCHHCGHSVTLPKQCPDCKHDDCLIPFGPGVERVAEEVRALLPDARVGVMTSDGCSIGAGANEKPVPPEAVIHAMIAGEIDILVGTQMIAKGHHFGNLALVGVLDADMGLAGGDLRAGERTYQLLHQLAGRAGREATKGDVWLQTYQPTHPVMQALAAGERDRFMALEAQMREEALMPPYGKLAALIIEGKSESEVAAFARALVMRLGIQDPATPSSPSPLILGPAPAPLLMLRGKYRYRILIKATRQFALQSWLDARVTLQPPKTLRVKVDIDPYNFL